MIRRRVWIECDWPGCDAVLEDNASVFRADSAVLRSADAAGWRQAARGIVCPKHVPE